MFRKIRMFSLYVFIVVMLLLAFNSEASDEFKYKLNFMPWSVHHGSTRATNERHKGIGLSVTLPNRFTYGLMHYKNSYGDRGWVLSVSTEIIQRCTVCPGIGVGYAPAYDKSGRPVVIGWLSFRYKWVTLLSVPNEVSAFMLSIPFD